MGQRLAAVDALTVDRVHEALRERALARRLRQRLAGGGQQQQRREQAAQAQPAAVKRAR
jgi:hypothetical protein